MPLFATHTKPFGLNATPHGFLRFGSVCDAAKAPSETRMVDLKRVLIAFIELLSDPPHEASPDSATIAATEATHAIARVRIAAGFMMTTPGAVRP
ncbi:hypothetical protein AWB68_07250 [Caballeronia choica]|uniref:Uncharacterized protein n=1 Tax=Caballeronia choica TaxID=326476 RepID=A0A158KTK7_9BURK|nr:hypothetical protein AWB68_07250 [Caballeronia choica]